MREGKDSPCESDIVMAEHCGDFDFVSPRLPKEKDRGLVLPDGLI